MALAPSTLWEKDSSRRQGTLHCGCGGAGRDKVGPPAGSCPEMPLLFPLSWVSEGGNGFLTLSHKAPKAITNKPLHR